MRWLLEWLLLSSVLFAAAQPAPVSSEDYSGLYSFLRDGEFLQITVEDKGKVSGFISRYGDSDSDKEAFLDQFFASGKLDQNHLSFTTQHVHEIWFTFEGVVERGPGKAPEDEAYYVLRGTLTRFRSDEQKSASQESHQVEFKSFPRDSSP
jgi:hypothetical protein